MSTIVAATSPDSVNRSGIVRLILQVSYAPPVRASMCGVMYFHCSPYHSSNDLLVSPVESRAVAVREISSCQSCFSCRLHSHLGGESCLEMVTLCGAYSTFAFPSCGRGIEKWKRGACPATQFSIAAGVRLQLGQQLDEESTSASLSRVQICPLVDYLLAAPHLNLMPLERPTAFGVALVDPTVHHRYLTC